MGKRGPPKRPAELSKLLGNPGKRSDDVQETQFPTGLPVPPETLSDVGRRAWGLFCEAGRGVIRPIDSMALGILCHAIEDVHGMRQRAASAGGVHKLEMSARKALRESEATAAKLGARFGWSPYDRDRTGPAEPASNPLADLLARRQQRN